MRTFVRICTLLLISTAFLSAQQRALFDYNRSMGKGVNLGNVFEAPVEGTWGNPFKDDFFIKIKQAGFGHVRIPTRWDTPERCLQNTPYTINPVFMSRMQYVVDLALASGLKVILNMHHHDEIFTNPNGVKPRFLSQWNQIATHFKSYPDGLILEVMNEPHDLLSPELWNVFFADALKEIRKTNPTRVVLMGVAEYGGLGALGKLVPPADTNVIATIHYYNPFQFTHQGADWTGTQSQEWLGTKWNDLEAERDVMKQEFASAKQYEKDHNIPINIGEFGAYEKADMASRVRWTTFLARYLESIDFSWAYWEWSAGFGVYNPTNGQYKTDLLNALISNPMPEPTKTINTLLFESNFVNTTGWNLQTSSGASAAMTATNGQLNVNVNRIGSQGWHIQLMRLGFNLEKGKMYKLSFEGKAAGKNGVAFYMGKNSDPWNSYSGFNSISLGTEFAEYSTLFTMSSNTDPAARMVFDLGSQTGLIELRKVKLEEVKLDFGTPTFDINDHKVVVYPNPASESFTITGIPIGHNIANLYDVKGRLVYQENNVKEGTQIPVKNLAKGVYMFQIIAGKEAFTQGIVIE